MKILISVPTYETIYPDTLKSIYELDKCGNDVDFNFIRGFGVANARNIIAKGAVDNGYDYVLMIDNDIVLPKDALINLLDISQSYLDRCVVVGYCLRRLGEYNIRKETTAYKYGDINYLSEDAYKTSELLDLCRIGITKVLVRGSGFACALVHRSVLESMSYPYFKWVDYYDGSQLSEDLYFCERLNELSIPILLDPRVGCGHLMRHVDFI